MTDIRLVCDTVGCRERLTVAVRNVLGPWQGRDVAVLQRTAARSGWSADIDERDGTAFVYCPEHVKAVAS